MRYAGASRNTSASSFFRRMYPATPQASIPILPMKSISMNDVNIFTSKTKYQLNMKNGKEPTNPNTRNVRGENVENAITVATSIAWVLSV